MNIEQTHANNFRLIRKYNLQKGTLLEHKKYKFRVTIDHIHPLYGWVVEETYRLKQDLSNIEDFKVIESTLTQIDILEAINIALSGQFDDGLFTPNNQLIPTCLYDEVIRILLRKKPDFYPKDYCIHLWQMCYAMKGAKPNESA